MTDSADQFSAPSPACLTILGSTGSIGCSTLDVVARHPDRYRIHALTANTRVEALLAQCLRFAPRFAVLRDVRAAAQLREQLAAHGSAVEVLGGPQALDKVASDPEVDSVMAAIVGGAGLDASMAAAMAGKRVLLANKEALVMAGQLFMNAVRDNGACLLPIDSEHNAIFQCLPASMQHLGKLPEAASQGVSRILLTGSGGPFRTTPLEQLEAVSPDQACAHPNWDMGRKISVDSATMMNKGLELIEACWLFDTTPDHIDIVIHPQSVVHSMVQYNDGSVLAQLGNPDMRTPIAYGLAWPDRVASGVAGLDIIATARLDFEAPDEQRFPALRLAAEAFRRGGSAMITLNAANEVAVEAFLREQIRFTQITTLIETVLQKAENIEPLSLAAVKQADAAARQLAKAAVADLYPLQQA